MFRNPFSRKKTFWQKITSGQKIVLAGVVIVAILVVGSFATSTDDLQGRFSKNFRGAKKLNPLSPILRLAPDLVVDDIYLDGTLLTVKSANIGNISVSPTTNGYTYIYIDDVLEWTYSWSTLADLSFLTAGDSSVIQPQVLTGNHEVRACVDESDIVSESDETNNCLTINL